MTLFEVKQISVKYGSIPALTSISITCGFGEIVVILGPNGAGKSTLLKGIMGLVPVSEGEIWHKGERIDRLPVYQIARRGISLVPEGRRPFSNMSVIENLFVGGFQRPKEKIESELVETVQVYFPRLMERKKQIAGTLSGGEQQMLVIARALMSGAELILLDEPSLGLSPIMIREIIEVVLRLNREKKVSIIMVEQNAHLGLQLANSAYVLEGGRIVLEGVSSELLKSEKIIQAYIGIDTRKNKDNS